MSLILASRSPRRVELLRAAGFRCEVYPTDVDERRLGDEPPEVYVSRVAALKADSAARHYPLDVVVGADTAVVVGQDVLGKPSNPEDARRMLRALAGRSHVVLTGVAVRGGGEPVTWVETTTVHMRALDDAAITWYVASGEPLDKAGGYAIQGLASRFVVAIEGSYSNVVGLPVSSVAAVLAGRLGAA
jgi:septum formation protein